MIKFILLVILFIILYPIVKLWLMMRGVRNGLRQTQQQGYGANGYGYQPEPEQQQGKVLSDVEEDAEFETVEGPRREIDRPSRVETEDQVTDAEFEEID